MRCACPLILPLKTKEYLFQENIKNIKIDLYDQLVYLYGELEFWSDYSFPRWTLSIKGLLV